MLELNPCVRNGEVPGNRAFPIVVPGNTCLHLTLHSLNIRYPPVQALLAENTYFQFGHVKPRSVSGRVMDLETTAKAMRLLRFKGRMQRGQVMDVQIVHHKNNHFGLRVPVVRYVPKSLAVRLWLTVTCRRLPNGSKATKRFAAPLRTYS